MKFSDFLKEIRTTAGYTQQDVAQILKTDRSTYAYYESGKTEPNIRSLRRIANLYGITIDELLECRIRPTASRLANYENPGSESLRMLRNLSNEERRLVMLYRACCDKNGLLRVISDFEDTAADPQAD